MAVQRNYTAPSFVTKLIFSDSSTASTVEAHLWIGGAHVNTVSGNDSYIGVFDASTGLNAFWPEIITDKSLVDGTPKVYLKNALLRYFSTDTETFNIPANSKNVVLGAATFSFAQAGDNPRSAVFYDRDVKSGDTVKVTKGTDEFWTTVNTLVPHKVDPSLEAIEAAATNAAASTEGTTPGENVTSATITDAGSVTTALAAKGLSTDTIVIYVSEPGTAANAKFQVSSSAFPTASFVGSTFTYGGVEVVLTPASFAEGDMFTVGLTATYTAVEPTVSGTYTGPAKGFAAREVIYTLVVKKGGALPADAPANAQELATRPVLTLSTSDGSERLQSVIVQQGGVDFSIGSYGIKLNIPAGALITGDSFTFVLNAPYYDGYNGILLNHNIPSDWVSSSDEEVSITLYIAPSYLEIPQEAAGVGLVSQNWTLDTDNNQIFINGNLAAYDKSWTLAGVQQSLPVVAGTKDVLAYFETSFYATDLINKITQITSRDFLEQTISGPIDPSNPLKYAAYWALEHGAEVYVTAIPNPATAADWQNAADLIAERDDLFFILPLIEGNPELTQIFYQHITLMNDPEIGRERMLYLIDYTKPSDLVVGDGGSKLDAPVMGRITVESLNDISYLALTDETLVTDVDFTTLDIQAGDSVRINFTIDEFGKETYDTYIVSEVINATTIRLRGAVTGFVPYATAQSYQIVENRTLDEQANLISETGGVQDFKVVYILVDSLDGIDPIGPAATLLGLIAAVVPHQGVTWYPLSGWSSDLWNNKFNRQQNNFMAGNGVLIINKHADGYICARHAVTTNKEPVAGVAIRDINTMQFEEMFVRNALLVLKEFRAATKGFVGVTNIAQGTLKQIWNNIWDVSKRLQDDSDYPLLGGRIDGDIQNLVVKRHAFLRDRILVSGTIVGRFPLNNGEFDLYITGGPSTVTNVTSLGEATT